MTRTMIGVGAALAASLMATASFAQTTLRVAGNFPMDHTATKAMEIFKDELESRTDGDLTVQNFPAMQLGGAQENVDQVRSGAIFAVFTSVAYFTRSVPALEAVSLPFQFDSREQAFAVMDGEVGDYLDQQLLDEGFVNLGYGELGYRNVTNNVRPIETVEDFDGLKIRLQPNEVHIDTFRQLGANPQPMDISEVYSALQQGVLDGEENPYNIIFTRRFFEVQDYLSDTGHFFDFINVVANKDRFESLSDENQQAVRAAMDKAIEWQRAEAKRVDLDYRQNLIDEGMTFTPISDEERAKMRKAVQPVIENVKERVGSDVIEMVQKATEEASAAQ